MGAPGVVRWSLYVPFDSRHAFVVGHSVFFPGASDVSVFSKFPVFRPAAYVVKFLNKSCIGIPVALRLREVPRSMDRNCQKAIFLTLYNMVPDI